MCIVNINRHKLFKHSLCLVITVKLNAYYGRRKCMPKTSEAVVSGNYSMSHVRRHDDLFFVHSFIVDINLT